MKFNIVFNIQIEGNIFFEAFSFNTSTVLSRCFVTDLKAFEISTPLLRKQIRDVLFINSSS